MNTRIIGIEVRQPALNELNPLSILLSLLLFFLFVRAGTRGTGHFERRRGAGNPLLPVGYISTGNLDSRLWAVAGCRYR